MWKCNLQDLSLSLITCSPSFLFSHICSSLPASMTNTSNFTHFTISLPSLSYYISPLWSFLPLHPPLYRVRFDHVQNTIMNK